MVAIAGDGARAFTSDIGAGAVSAMDLVKGTLVRLVPVGPRVEGIAVAPDGSTVWAGSNTNGTVSVIDTKTGAIVETLGGLFPPLPARDLGGWADGDRDAGRESCRGHRGSRGAEARADDRRGRVAGRRRVRAITEIGTAG